MRPGHQSKGIRMESGAMNRMTTAHNSEIMTVKELSRYLRLHTSTVYRLLRRGELPGFKIGDSWRFNQQEINLWLLQHTAEGRKPS